MSSAWWIHPLSVLSHTPTLSPIFTHTTLSCNRWLTCLFYPTSDDPVDSSLHPSGKALVRKGETHWGNDQHYKDHVSANCVRTASTRVIQKGNLNHGIMTLSLAPFLTGGRLQIKLSSVYEQIFEQIDGWRNRWINEGRNGFHSVSCFTMKTVKTGDKTFL